MKLTADQYYCVYFCVFEEPAMFKPLSYSSVFVSHLCFELITQASRQKTYEQAWGPGDSPRAPEFWLQISRLR